MSPHDKVYTRLGVSAIAGVGVFAIRDIPKGTYVFDEDADEKCAEVPKAEVDAIEDEAVRKLYEDFCVLENDIYYCPKSFNAITPAWYLNHSDTPNMGCDDGYMFFALRDIKKGEELFSNYNTYDDHGLTT